MDADDITQEILVKACTRADVYNGMSDGELYVSLSREAVAYCARERADYVTRTARYIYTPDEARALLSIAVETLGAEWDAPTKDGYVAAPDAGNVVVSLWDLRAALDELRPDWRDVLVRRAEGETYSAAQREEAQARGWRPVARGEHMKHSRALERLTQILNRTVNRPPGDHDGPGARKAVSNARALATTHDDRDGK
ncbi:hypothetical protein [Nonomuraea roseola]|uniref:Terminase small subunit n=1 Tax=Nonomuraea roseola TaxID=46179 RepID=A0ABV5Q0P3_9ACTN